MEGDSSLGNPCDAMATYEFCFPQCLFELCQHLPPNEHKWMKANCHHADSPFQIGLLKKGDEWINMTLQGVQSDMFEEVLDRWQCHVNRLTPATDTVLSYQANHEECGKLKSKQAVIPSPKKSKSAPCIPSANENMLSLKIEKSATDQSQSPRRSSRRSVKRNSLINDDIFDLGTRKRNVVRFVPQSLETVNENTASNILVEKPCLKEAEQKATSSEDDNDDCVEKVDDSSENFFTPYFAESSSSSILSVKTDQGTYRIECADAENSDVTTEAKNENSEDNQLDQGAYESQAAIRKSGAQSALRKRALNRVLKTKSQLAKYKRMCHLCQYVCYTEKTLRNHAIYKHHLSWPAFKAAIREDADDDVVAAKTAVVPPKGRRPHRQASDPSVDAHACPACPRRFIVFAMLQRHVQCAHPGVATPVGPAKRVSAVVSECVICGVSNNGVRAISHVQREHADHPDFENILEMTQKRFQSERCRLARAQQPPGKVACKYCGGYYERNGVRAHMLYRCRENPSRTQLYSCRSCGYGTPFPEHLRAHMKTHPATNKRCYVCEACGRTYATRPGLSMHARVAHGDKPDEENICEECGKTFEFAHRLQRHLKVHTGERKFACDLCTRTFKAANTLKRHRETYHFDRYRFRCEVCGHGVDKQQYLDKHVCGRVRRGRNGRSLANTANDGNEDTGEKEVPTAMEVVVDTASGQQAETNKGSLHIIMEAAEMEIGKELQISTEPQVFILEQNGVTLQISSDGHILHRSEDACSDEHTVVTTAAEPQAVLVTGVNKLENMTWNKLIITDGAEENIDVKSDKNTTSNAT